MIWQIAIGYGDYDVILGKGDADVLKGSGGRDKLVVHGGNDKLRRGTHETEIVETVATTLERSAA